MQEARLGQLAGDGKTVVSELTSQFRERGRELFHGFSGQAMLQAAPYRRG